MSTAGSPTAPATTSGKIPPEVIKVAVATLVGGMAVLFDSTIVAVGIHRLSDDLGVGLDVIQWVSTAYLLALAVAVPLVGWLQRVVGGKRLWMIALGIFLVGSVLCSLAWSAPSLIAFRAFQGLGGGLLMPLMMTLIMQVAGGQNLGKMAAVIGLPVALGPVLGPVFGGLILQYLHWSWLFWVNIPFCVVGLILAWRWLPKDEAPTPARLDIVGLLLLAPGLAGILYGLSNVSKDGAFTRTDVWPWIVAGLVLVGAFVAWALPRKERALIDIRLLGHRPLAVSSSLMFLSGFGLFGAMFLLPLYFQELHGASLGAGGLTGGYDVLTTGLILIPQGIGTLLSRVLMGRFIDRVGPRWIALPCFLITAIATIPFAFAGADTSVWWLMVVLLIRGIGLGGAIIPLMAYGFSGIAKQDVPDASIVNRIFQQLGGSFGTGILATVLAGGVAGASSIADVAGGFQAAFWWGSAFTGLAVVLSFLLPATRPGQAEVAEGQIAAAEG